MPGSAGSKYGIFNEGIPVKKMPKNRGKKKLKDIRMIIKKKAQEKNGIP